MEAKELEEIKINYNGASNKTDKNNYYKQFLIRVFEAIDKECWLYVPCLKDDQTVRPMIINFHSRLYIAVYAIKENLISKDMACLDINKAVDTLYSSGEISGIIFDPNNDPIIINRELINDNTNRKDPRLQQHNWGVGIPDYKKSDLLTNIEIFDFAMQVVYMYFQNEGYTILNKVNFPGAINNYEVEKNSKKYFVVVRGYLYDNKKELSEEEKQELIEMGKKYDEIPTIANVGFGSADSERFIQKLALYGDGYYCNFSGLEEIN